MNLKTFLNFRKTLSVIFSFLICGLLFLFTEVQLAQASLMGTLKNSNTNVVEHIRLSVPAEDRKSWLIAEKESWEPWLDKQDGFLGRQLLWDQKQEEAFLLIKWSSRAKWKSIPQSEIDSVQELFEKISRELTQKDSTNPFPIKFEGELLPQ